MGSQNQFITEITAADFNERVLENPRPVVLDFYSTECPPCEALAPKFEALAQRFGDRVDFFKIFRQENRELAEKLGVRSSPTLLFFQSGKETSDRLTGGIRKAEMIEGLKTLLPETAFKNPETPAPRKIRGVDLAVLGGGPAGLTAALYAAQAKLNTLVLDQDLPGGQVRSTHLIANYPGTEKALPGWELAHRMESQVRESGGDILPAVDVTGVEFSNDPLREPHRILVDDDLEIRAAAVVLATGAHPRPLGVPGEKEYAGRGISYCATCDGKFYEGREVYVIGGGNSAVEESLFLTRFASKVTIVHQFDRLQANRTAQEKAFASDKIDFLWSHEPRGFETAPEGRMRLTLENQKTGERIVRTTDGVFVFVGMEPNTTVLPNSIERDDYGYFLTDEDMQTNLPGVYAVGDLRRKKVRQAATAVADGCIAAVMAERYIESGKTREATAERLAG